MDLTSALMAYDEVISQAAREGRPITTADKLRAMKAAIEAYEADKIRARQQNVLPPTRGTDSQRDALSYELSAHAQQYGVGRTKECATCGLEIWPANSLRGWGNYKQYCSCVRVQVPK